MSNPNSVEEALAVVENAYVVRVDQELDARVNAALDFISKSGATGVRTLVDRLFKDMTLKESYLSAVSKGELDHNEWLKRAMIVRAIGRSGSPAVVRDLAPLLTATSGVSQFYDILRPAVALAIGDLGGTEAGDALHAAQKSASTDYKTTAAILEALGHLEGAKSGATAPFVDISKRKDTGRIGILVFRSKASLLDKIFKPRALYEKLGGMTAIVDKSQRAKDLFTVLRKDCEPIHPYIYGNSFIEAWGKGSGDLSLVVDFEDHYPRFEKKMGAQNYNGEWDLLTAYATHAIALGLAVQVLNKKGDVVLNL